MKHLRHRRARRLAASVRPLLPARLEVPVRFWTMRALGVLEPEVARLAEWLPDDAVAVDAGANFGPYTYALSKRCAEVHAVEPNPVCARALRAWRADNVRVHELALSDTTATGTLTIPVLDGAERPTRGTLAAAADGHTVSVSTARLDDLGLERVDFVKIDVEGHESAVVRGAAATLRRCRPVLLVEIVDRERAADDTARDLIDTIEALGYEGALLAPGGEVAARDFDARVHQPLEDGRHGVGYANMFLFRPRA